MERRRKKELKKKRRAKESQLKYSQKVQAEVKEVATKPTATQFSRSAWQALSEPGNMAQQEPQKPVLNENQGFQTNKWKPHEETSD
jgi:hypothetical protein